jgi:SpoIIAA-like
MITFLNQELSTVIGFRLEGKLSAEDIDRIAEILEQKFDTEESVNLYIEIADDLEESFGAILEHAKVGFTVILPNLGKIEKAALVSDKSWLRNITDFQGMFLSMEIKGFPLDEKEVAVKWINSLRGNN